MAHTVRASFSSNIKILLAHMCYGPDQSLLNIVERCKPVGNYQNDLVAPRLQGQP
jgi:hypothetical protein